MLVEYEKAGNNIEVKLVSRNIAPGPGFRHRKSHLFPKPNKCKLFLVMKKSNRRKKYKTRIPQVDCVTKWTRPGLRLKIVSLINKYMKIVEKFFFFLDKISCYVKQLRFEQLKSCNYNE